jgi:hypothetical protein
MNTHKFARSYVAAALAVATVVAAAGAASAQSFPTVGEHTGNARPNHYDPKTGRQVSGWTVEDAAPKASGPRLLHNDSWTSWPGDVGGRY